VNDPVIGKLVKVNAYGEVSFHDPDGSQPDLDLNWKRLRTMAQPVVDEQLAQLAMAGKWKKQPIRLSLGTLLLDNSTIRFDKDSYDEMEQDREKDLDQCEVAWGRKMDSELTKRGITKVAQKFVKYKKWSTVYEINKNKKDRKGMDNGMKLKAGKAIKEEEEDAKTKDETLKTDELDVTESLAEVQVPVEESRECEHCCEQPCVWWAKKEDMIFCDTSEHAHLPQEDLPPNNIRRKKMYRQMTLHIQEGHVQKGVRHALPECVEMGVRELFPSPTFMGFRSTY
jgi:hypothetical protein